MRTARRPDAAVDEVDAALSAFDSFCAGAARGQFANLFDRDDLWRLLAVITSRKVFALARRQGRTKRGGRQVLNISDLCGAEGFDEAEILSHVVGSEPTPESAAIMAAEYSRLLAIEDETLRRIAVRRMGGVTNDGIGINLGSARWTLARQLALIRKI